MVWRKKVKEKMTSKERINTGKEQRKQNLKIRANKMKNGEKGKERSVEKG